MVAADRLLGRVVQLRAVAIPCVSWQTRTQAKPVRRQSIVLYFVQQDQPNPSCTRQTRLVSVFRNEHKTRAYRIPCTWWLLLITSHGFSLSSSNVVAHERNALLDANAEGLAASINGSAICQLLALLLWQMRIDLLAIVPMSRVPENGAVHLILAHFSSTKTMGTSYNPKDAIVCFGKRRCANIYGRV